MEIYKGTPAPWYPHEFAGYWSIMDGDYYEANNTTDADDVGEEKAKANVYLQAAAPELLEALHNLVQLKEWKDKHGNDEHYENAKERAWRDARSAISKALNQEV